MGYGNHFRDLLESIPDYRKIVLLLFSIKNDVDFLNESRFLKNDYIRLNLEFKKILMEQNEHYLDHIKNQEEATIEKILNK